MEEDLKRLKKMEEMKKDEPSIVALAAEYALGMKQEEVKNPED
jgi:hypothetical protein